MIVDFFWCDDYLLRSPIWFSGLCFSQFMFQKFLCKLRAKLIWIQNLTQKKWTRRRRSRRRLWRADEMEKTALAVMMKITENSEQAPKIQWSERSSNKLKKKKKKKPTTTTTTWKTRILGCRALISAPCSPHTPPPLTHPHSGHTYPLILLLTSAGGVRDLNEFMVRMRVALENGPETIVSVQCDLKRPEQAPKTQHEDARCIHTYEQTYIWTDIHVYVFQNLNATVARREWPNVRTSSNQRSWASCWWFPIRHRDRDPMMSSWETQILHHCAWYWLKKKDTQKMKTKKEWKKEWKKERKKERWKWKKIMQPETESKSIRDRQTNQQVYSGKAGRMTVT